ncbi:MAG TPA: hypothetical protein VF549_13910 [Solirubrobacteraceae bacterium]|jgi:hypothetical protein
MLRTFVAMRVLVGGVTWLAPEHSARMSGFDPGANPQAAYWARLFGVRDVVLGLAAHRSSGAARRRIVALTGACDAADLAATVVGRRAGHVPPRAALLSGAVAAAAGAVAWAAASAVE